MNHFFYLFLFLISALFFGQKKENSIIIKGPIFKVSYNETFEQPNWIEYEVRNIKKKIDRKGYNFYKVDSVYTSNNADYNDNIWDKGHLAPAAAFSDTKSNLYATFSFLNCVLQHENLNRNEWAQLERKVRYWANLYQSNINVRVDVLFKNDHQILASGAHVPSAFKKSITFPDGTSKCYYFVNQPTNGKDWTEFEIDCF